MRYAALVVLLVAPGFIQWAKAAHDESLNELFASVGHHQILDDDMIARNGTTGPSSDMLFDCTSAPATMSKEDEAVVQLYQYDYEAIELGICNVGLMMALQRELLIMKRFMGLLGEDQRSKMFSDNFKEDETYQNVVKTGSRMLIDVMPVGAVLGMVRRIGNFAYKGYTAKKWYAGELARSKIIAEKGGQAVLPFWQDIPYGLLNEAYRETDAAWSLFNAATQGGFGDSSIAWRRIAKGVAPVGVLDKPEVPKMPGNGRFKPDNVVYAQHAVKLLRINGSWTEVIGITYTSQDGQSLKQVRPGWVPSKTVDQKNLLSREDALREDEKLLRALGLWIEAKKTGLSAPIRQEFDKNWNSDAAHAGSYALAAGLFVGGFFTHGATWLLAGYLGLASKGIDLHNKVMKSDHLYARVNYMLLSLAHFEHTLVKRGRACEVGSSADPASKCPASFACVQQGVFERKGDSRQYGVCVEVPWPLQEPGEICQIHMECASGVCEPTSSEAAKPRHNTKGSANATAAENLLIQMWGTCSK